MPNGKKCLPKLPAYVAILQNHMHGRARLALLFFPLSKLQLYHNYSLYSNSPIPTHYITSPTPIPSTALRPTSVTAQLNKVTGEVTQSPLLPS